MDPNACWEEMLRLSEEMQRPPAHPGDMMLNGERLAELTLALRDWLAKGGFPPKAFNPYVQNSKTKGLENHPEWW